MAYHNVIQALADPTRRAIFERLRDRPQSVGELASRYPISRPAVSQHLKVLKEAHLVRATRRGTKHIYHADPKGLEELRRYLEGYWGDILDAFKSKSESTINEEDL